MLIKQKYARGIAWQLLENRAEELSPCIVSGLVFVFRQQHNVRVGFRGTLFCDAVIAQNGTLALGFLSRMRIQLSSK